MRSQLNPVTRSTGLAIFLSSIRPTHQSNLEYETPHTVPFVGLANRRDFQRRICRRICQVIAAKEDGFVSMFNGKDLEGWKINENPDSWKVEDGQIVCNGERSHLFYEGDGKPFKNFVFRAEVKDDSGSNSGIYFHTKFQPEGWPKYGYECQVNISQGDPKKSSGLYAVQDVFDPPAKDNEWYTQEIVVEGRKVTLKINDKTLVEYTEPENKQPFDSNFERRLGNGTFALQAHDPESKVYFRNLRVKRLED